MVTSLEFREKTPPSAAGNLQIQLLGTLAIRRAGQTLVLPASRKVRALIACLALAPRPVTRAHLCELLCEGSSDPRAELSWCLSKIRSLLDDSDFRRVQTVGVSITLRLQDCFVDAVAIEHAIQTGIARSPASRLVELSELCSGEFLDSLELDRNPRFGAWLIARRRHFRACHAAILEELVNVLPADSLELLSALENWLEIAALDCRAHEKLLNTLARQGRTREGIEHLTVTSRLFESEGLDSRPLQDAWQIALMRHRNASARAVSAHAVASAVVAPRRRASIAVMPLVELPASPAAAPVSTAQALIHDVITRLARLRSLTVIAQGTVFALNQRLVGPVAEGRILNVDYVASGSVRRETNRIIVLMELTETRTARIVWAGDFDATLDDTFLVLDEIGNRIVAAIAGEIEACERNLAILKAPTSLDAWEAHHRGLWHMYRFTAADNELAQGFFQLAVRLDPTFSRAYGGLSFTHWQSAFVHRTMEREEEMECALAAAAQGLIVDDRDPAAHWAMGRALWLLGQQEECLRELQLSVELSPNFALGHAMLAVAQSQSGDPRAAIESADCSRKLSPFDPMLFVASASRAIAHLRLGQFDDAAVWAVKAARRPNVHVHVRAIAAHCLAAAERMDEARGLVASIRKTDPTYCTEDYLASLRVSEDTLVVFRSQVRLAGIS